MKARGLGQLAKNLKALTKVPADVAREAAKGIEKAINDSFDKGQDPYGNKWADLANGDPSYLQETEKMRDSLEVKPLQHAGIGIEIDDKPTVFHMRGTRKMPARPPLPTGVMPDTWTQAIEKAYKRAMKKRYAGNS